ncbi:MAG TPA: M20/M25/M40 family metallo-hydrolase [Steroidobacteraceae bacterium]|nr:M20/M25/M40 family metallo-hydrolase [Steroidobacteraceae bacterium]
MNNITRRKFVAGAAGTSAALWLAQRSFAASNLAPIYAEVQRRHQEAVARFQEWIRHFGIAAENNSVSESCEFTMGLLRDAGFQHVERIATDRHPGIFATLDAGAKRTLAVYFMYDVKQVEGQEWSVPPWEARLVEMPDLGTVVMGRGAVNQKGPESSFLAALHAIRGAKRKLPVNLVLLAEGEEEIGSPHIRQLVLTPTVRAALEKCDGIFMPDAAQDRDGTITISLGAKGVVEAELVASGKKWGRGPLKDIHSSNRARVDSPPWHLVQALNTLVDAKGDPAIDGLLAMVKPISAADQKMLDEAALRISEQSTKQSLGVEHWARDASWRQALEDICFRPTVNIEGLVGGYTGAGGMTILPHQAAAKLDLRLVPDMTWDDTVTKLKAHLNSRGYGDIEVNVTGGYDPTTTAADSRLVQVQRSVYRSAGVDPIMWPRRGGSWPGYVFTGAPLKLAAIHHGMGHGARAHAPDEYYLIDSKNPKLVGMDGAVRSFVDLLFALA